MCAIAGVLWADPNRPAWPDGVRQVLDLMRHRGPDATGVFAEGPVAIGNARLAILGIDERGNQPIYNEDKSIAVVFNGEIYNFPELRRELEAKGHHFSTETDTELLVHLYEEHGAGMAGRLNGMFAFALFDRKNKHLLLGRDRTSQKPLFLHHTPERLAFASELSALLHWIPSPRLNLDAARDFLSLGYFLEPETIIQGVSTLPPGCVRVYQQGKIISEITLELPPFQTPRPPCSLNEWLEKAEASFLCAVKRHTLSDVPVTVFLSGGVDSSLVAAALSRCGGITTACTGSFSDEPDFDEARFSTALASRMGFQVRQINLSRKNLADALPDFLATASQPQGDYSGLPSYVLARETARDFKVVLGGDGGDELFAGYPTLTLPLLTRKLWWLPAAVIRASAHLARMAGPPRGYLPWRFRLQLLGQAWPLQTPFAHYAIKDFLPKHLAGTILNSELAGPLVWPPPGMGRFSELLEKISRGNPPPESSADIIKCLARLDFLTFLASCTIPKMERNCMRWSLENRLPFLDLEVLHLAASTPAQWLWRQGRGKWALRELFKKWLGSSRLPVNPRKQGFGPPLASMLRAELREWAADMLRQPYPLFSPQAAGAVEEHQKAGWDLHRLIWNICTLKDWCLRHRVLPA